MSLTDDGRPGVVRTDPVPVDEHDLRSAFDNAPIGMAVVTPTGTITGCNPALGRLLGRAPAALVGGTFFDVTYEEDLPEARAACLLVQEGAPRMRHDCRFVRSDGTVTWVSVSTSRVPDAPGRAAHLIMHVEDVSGRKALEAELSRQALHDPLTGLPNRSLLLDRTDRVLRRAARDGGHVSLVFLDLDGFKDVNDRHGHAAGDRVLVELASRVLGAVRPGDTVARLGGDEFVVLCEDTDADQAGVVADRLRAVAREPFELGDAQVRLTAAVGVGHHDPRVRPVPTSEELLHRADLAMYQAKRAGEGQAAAQPQPGSETEVPGASQR